MSEEYKKAMDKIVLSDDLKEEILKNAIFVSSEKSAEKKPSGVKSFVMHRGMRYAACAAVCLMLTAAAVTLKDADMLDPEQDSLGTYILSESDKNVIPSDTYPDPEGTAQPAENTDNNTENSISYSADNKSNTENTGSNIYSNKNNAKEVSSRAERAETSLSNTANRSGAADAAQTMTITNGTNDSTPSARTDSNDMNTEMNTKTISDPSPASAGSNIRTEPVPQSDPDDTDISDSSALPDLAEAPLEMSNELNSGDDCAYSDNTSIAEIQNELGYSIKTPHYVPSGYLLTDSTLLFGEIVQLTYKSEKNEMTYRTALMSDNADTNGTDDIGISGDYNEYDDVKTEEINKNRVTLKGSGDKYYTAVWSENNTENNTNSYSLSFENGESEETFEKVIESVDYADSSIDTSDPSEPETPETSPGPDKHDDMSRDNTCENINDSIKDNAYEQADREDNTKNNIKENINNNIGSEYEYTKDAQDTADVHDAEVGVTAEANAVPDI